MLAPLVAMMRLPLMAADAQNGQAWSSETARALHEKTAALPLDTVFNAFYSVPLAQYKHGTFRFYARSADLLDHETVTDTVTVTVK